jgi:hypothetical protein
MLGHSFLEFSLALTSACSFCLRLALGSTLGECVYSVEIPAKPLVIDKRFLYVSLFCCIFCSFSALILSLSS